MTDEEAKAAFWAAVGDPDPSSIEIAQDIALEHGWKLWQLGEERADELKMWFGHHKKDPKWESVGGFWYGDHDSGCDWKISWRQFSGSQFSGARRAGTYVIEVFFDFLESHHTDHPAREQWQWESSGIYDTIYDARRAAVRYCWYALKVMKNGYADDASAQLVRNLIEARQLDEVIPEINPALDPEEAFWAAVEDPDPSSMEIAKDIALENGFKLWRLGEDRGELEFDPEAILQFRSLGTFYYKDKDGNYNGGEWRVREGFNAPRFKVELRFEYQGEAWEIVVPMPAMTLASARAIGAQRIWTAVTEMKEGQANGRNLTFIRSMIYTGRPEQLPAELNPARLGEEDPKADTVMQILRDPQGGEGAMTIAQDFMLENGMKLQDVGESLATMMSALKDDVADPSWESVGAFPAQFGTGGYFDGAYWLAWQSSTGKKWLIKIYVWYQGEQWNSEGTEPSNVRYASLNEARIRASQEAWHIVKLMRRVMNNRGGFTHTPRAFKAYLAANPLWSHATLPRELNPMRNKNPDDLAAARDKYKEFHRYDPKDVGAFSSSFTIPKRVRLAGRGKWVTYRSSKVDPSTLEKPKRPIDYIHEHDAGVYTYIKDDEPDTDVPEKFRDVAALVKLGECLGFCVIDADGEEVEAEGTNPLPELYSTPDGTCLFVIQGKREVLAMSWGGALGVFARGIDG